MADGLSKKVLVVSYDITKQSFGELNPERLNPTIKFDHKMSHGFVA
ncbi:hypothetical protein [Rickettsia endosymbiont of Urophora cardui]